MYEPKKDRWAVLNLLDDRFLDSNMTNTPYMVQGNQYEMS